MPISPARRAAYEVLQRVELTRGYAVDYLQRPDISKLRETDRRLAMEIVMGVERWRGELDFQIEQLSGKPIRAFDAEVLTILRMSVYQIRFLERVPKHGIVNDAVELTKSARKRSAAGLVNAVLRKCQPPAEHFAGGNFEDMSAENRASVRRAFPPWMLKRWEALTSLTANSGEAGALRLAWSCLAPARTTLRVVGASDDCELIQQELKAEGVATSRCGYAQSGLRVDSGQALHTRAYEVGRVVIQDEASQLVADLAMPLRGQRVLDLCAAPGIKSGQLAQALGAGTLVACDRSAARLPALRKLLPKWVPAPVQLSMVRLDAKEPLPFGTRFDRILLDAPCSGTGTLARNPEIKWRLRLQDLTRFAEIQTRILRNALPALASGGILVYATCSLEPEENDGVVEPVLRQESAYRMLTGRELVAMFPRLAAFFDARGYFRTRPDLHSMDGFTAAVIVAR